MYRAPRGELRRNHWRRRDGVGCTFAFFNLRPVGFNLCQQPTKWRYVRLRSFLESVASPGSQ